MSSNNKYNNADIHNQEHERWNRRSFLKALGLAGGGTIMLANTNVTASQHTELTQAIADAETDKVLVLIRLKGGNDGLNTIVPLYDYDNYANLRPNIRHEESSLFKLSDDFGIPPSLAQLQSMWAEGSMKVIHGVGYEEQNLSHFKSSDIWASTDFTGEEDSGYMGRYFEELYPDFLANPPEIPPAIQIGSIGNLIFDGRGVLNYSMTVANPEQLERIAKNGSLHGLGDLPDCTYGDRLEYLRSMANNTFTYGGVIGEAYNRGGNSLAYYDDSLGKQLAIVARMIKGNLGTKVYMVSLGGFDTHGNQIDRHDELMDSIAYNTKTFFEDLEQADMHKKVLATTISEFGRRAEENGSKGTDHGQAAPIMIFGPALDDNGFYGEHPSLTDLDRIGNLKYNFDFREIYAALMKEWLCVDANVVDRALLGETFEDKSFGFACDGLTTTIGEINSDIPFFHNVIQTDDSSILVIEKGDTSHVNVTLYDVAGAKVKTLRNEIMYPGRDYQINLSQEVGRGLSYGIYIYRILSGDKAFSAKTYIR